MGQPSVDSAMTRAQHFARARRWAVVAIAGLAVAVGAMVATRASENPIPRLLGVVAFLGMGVAVVSAGYRLLMGLSRPADWRPLAGEPLDRFDPEDEERSLRERIARELGPRLVGDVVVRQQNIVEPYPEDERSSWQKFVESTELMLPRYRFTCSIPTDTRQLVLNLWIGRSEHDASPARIRILLEGDCRVALRAPVSWREEFSGESREVGALASDRELAKLLPGLVRKRVLSGGRWIFHPDPHFQLAPFDDARARATLDTIEQDWKGGFSVKLGVDGFLRAVDRIEQLLGG